MDIGHALEPFEEIADGHRLVAADVVDIARLALFQQQPVGAHRVAHVGERSDAVEIADPDRPFDRPASTSAICLAKGAFRKNRAAPRARMGEHPGAQRLHLVGKPVLQRDHVLARLRYGRKDWPGERIGFTDRKLLLGHLSVDFRRAANMDCAGRVRRCARRQAGWSFQ